MAIAPSCGRLSSRDARAAAAAFFSRFCTFKQIVRPVSWSNAL